MPDVSDMDELADDISTLDSGISVVGRAMVAEQGLEKANAVASVDVDGMAGVSDRYAVLEKTIGNCEKVVEFNRMLEKSSIVASIDGSALERLVSEAGDAGVAIAKAESELSNARDLWKRQSNASKESKALATELKDAEEEFEKLKEELGVCPLCGAKL